MSLPSGSTISLTPLRRHMGDLMHASRQVPMVAIERRLHLADLIQARQALEVRPSWFALFMKAYALVAEQLPPLRQSYLTFPWERLHQHACNVANLAIARSVDGESGVLALQIRSPETKSLWEIDDLIRRGRTEPVENFGDYRRQLRTARLPKFLRRLLWWFGSNVSGHRRLQHFGTFGVTGVAALGSASLHLLSPLTTTLTYGVFEPDGSVLCRLFYDHRVLDGIVPCQALESLEKKLCGPLVRELRGDQPA